MVGTLGGGRPITELVLGAPGRPAAGTNEVDMRVRTDGNSSAVGAASVPTRPTGTEPVRGSVTVLKSSMFVVTSDMFIGYRQSLAETRIQLYRAVVRTEVCNPPRRTRIAG